MIMILTSIGCRPPTLPDPEVTGVDPTFAYNGDEETVTIEGSHFLPQVDIRAGDGTADVDRTFSAWLVGSSGTRYPFVGVSMQDDQHLRATLEEGVPDGDYSLTVEGPTGRTGTLDDGFTVTDTQAARLFLSTDQSQYTITAVPRIFIRVEDLGGAVAKVPLRVAVVAIPESGEAVAYPKSTLEDVAPTPDQDGIIGSLVDGRAEVSIVPPSPGTLVVSVAAWDDSEVVGDEIILTIDPGDDWSVELELPSGESAEPTFVAGVPFEVEARLVDQSGFPVEDAQDVTLVTRCSGWVGDVTLTGSTPVQVVPTIACEDDVVEVFDGPPGASAPFDVVAGPPDQFALDLGSFERSAGQILRVLVDPQDKHGNRAIWAGVVDLTASVGGLQDTSCEEDFGYFFCDTTVTVAGEGIEIEAFGDDGLSGTLGGLLVTAGEIPASATLTVSASPIVAGVATEVEVQTSDAWGNPMPAVVLGAGSFSIDDELGGADCSLTGYAASEGALFSCVLTTARPDAVLTVDVPEHGVTASAPAVEVVNGTLAEVRITGEAPVDAGEFLTLSFEGFDAWGNPYLVHGDPVIDLYDETNTWTETSATLGTDGRIDVTGTFHLSGTTTLNVAQAGVVLGVSDPIVVGAGPTTGLEVTVLAPWAWVGEAVDLRVESVDAFGNRTDFGGVATVTSTNTGSSSIDVTLVNGVGLDQFTWTGVAFPDLLEADDGVWFGVAPPVAVVDDCGVDNPTLGVDFGGHPEAITCLDAASDLATISSDLSSSVAGAQPLMGYAVAASSGVATIDFQPLIDIDVVGAGVHPLDLLVVDVAGCAVAGTAVGWAGPGDLSPVGPIEMSTGAASIDEWLGLADIDVTSVVDCSRDPASLQEVRVWTSAGISVGPTATGFGLSLPLDLNGDGAFSLETWGGVSDGTLEVHAWVPSGAAGGLLTLPLVGDNVFPTVVDQDPAGLTLDLVDEVVLAFSEKLWPASVSTSAFTLVGPGASVIASATLEGGDQVRLAFDTPADGAAGAWTVTALGGMLRDDAGNKLAGDWGAPDVDYVGAFGDVGGTVDGVVCPTLDPPGGVFRPDADPGIDIEADLVYFDLDSPQAPAWWVMEVTDGLGERVAQSWVVPVGPVDRIAWDGRDARGFVAPNGTYTVAIWPDDGLGNRGTGCTLAVTVDNLLEPTP